jgi:hypothetical protein
VLSELVLQFLRRRVWINYYTSSARFEVEHNPASRTDGSSRNLRTTVLITHGFNNSHPFLCHVHSFPQAPADS